MYPTLAICIEGEFIEDRAGEPVFDPATGSEIGHLPHATDQDLDAAVEAARLAFPKWRATSPYDRAAILRKTALLLRDRLEPIARILTLEQGKTLAEARRELAHSADVFDWFAEEGRRAYGRVVPGRDPAVEHLVVMEPVGPCAVFTPWNFPALTPVRKLAAGLAAGCTLILKAAEETPGTAVAIVRALHDAGLPAGAVNLVFGIPAHVSERLIAARAVRKISFTGSTPVGHHLLRLAADTGKRTTMELGGNAPVIVCDDAPIDAAVDLLAASKFGNAGQVCISPSRFFVHESRHAEFVAAFRRRAESLVLGSGLDPATTMGPLANGRRVAAIEGLITDAERRQARIARGPAVAGGGSFFGATVVTDIGDDAELMQREIFGPVVPIVPFASTEEAIIRANAVEAGLAGYAFTLSLARSRLIARELEVGMVGINSMAISSPEMPFGGTKQSGHGHESGLEGLRSYLNPQDCDTRVKTGLSLFDLTGKCAVITGGNGGIGLAIAEALGSAGARIVIAARRADKAQAALATLKMQGIDCGFVRCDLSDAQSCRDMIETALVQYGCCDILVTNAGISVRKLPQNLSDEDWRNVMGVNLDATFFTAQAVHPHMKERGGGKIIVLGSMYSLFGAPMVAAYGASKGAVLQLAKALGCAWAADNIQVNAILPGWIDTDLTAEARAQVDELDAMVRSRTPAGRWGEAADIGGAALFLASAASQFVTATSLIVDGGYSARG